MPDVTSSALGDAESSTAPTAAGPAADGGFGDDVAAPAPGNRESGETRRDGWTVTSVVVAAVLIAGCLASALSAILPSRTEIAYLPSAPALTEFALPAVKAIFDLAAALTIGWLLAAAWLVPPQRSGLLDVGGYRAIRAASLSASVWAAAGFALIPLTLSDALGKPLAEAASADWVISGISILDSVQTALVAAIAATLIAVISRVVLHRGWAALLLLIALIAVVVQSNSGHSAQSGNHDVAIDTMIFHLVGVSLWVGGLVAFLGLARQRVPHLAVIARRYSEIAFWAFIAVALSGVGNAWVRISYLADLWQTDYGRLVLLKAALLTTLGVIGYLHRRYTLPAITDHGDQRPLIRLAVVEIAIMAATIGVASALARTATPPPSGAAPGNAELTLGYAVDGPATAWRLVADWRFDWLLGTAAIVAVVVYVLAVRRLRRRGDSWPPGRTTAWIAGWATVLVATSSGLGRYAEVQFSIHMIAHMSLGMIAPILLVLGGPVSLALRALPAAGRGDVPGLREAIVGALHSKPARFVTSPLFVFPLFVFSFYALYFTSLFELMIGSHLGHLAMNLHFLLIGYLYYWVIIGVDPAPRQLHPMIKLAMLVGALPFHAFFGLALMNTHTAMAADYYNGLGLPWLTDLVGEERLGGAIAWGATEIPMIIVMIALLAQWARSDDREARRSDRVGDRRVDDELDAYNRMLAGLAAHDNTGPADDADLQEADLADGGSGGRGSTGRAAGGRGVGERPDR